MSSKPLNTFLSENGFYIESMPNKPNLKHGDSGKETLGERLARLRKEHGFTQRQLADKTGLIQVLISDYERGKLRVTAEMAIRFADALNVTIDELLRGRSSKMAPGRRQPSLKIMRRIEQIENLPPYQQRALLTTIDNFIAAAQER
jgi:transcriptional regulator with XRE-family HTH domain